MIFPFATQLQYRQALEKNWQKMREADKLHSTLGDTWSMTQVLIDEAAIQFTGLTSDPSGSKLK